MLGGSEIYLDDSRNNFERGQVRAALQPCPRGTQAHVRPCCGACPGACRPCVLRGKYKRMRGPQHSPAPRARAQIDTFVLNFPVDRDCGTPIVKVRVCVCACIVWVCAELCACWARFFVTGTPIVKACCAELCARCRGAAVGAQTV